MSDHYTKTGAEGLAKLRELIAAGAFHHATYRDQGKLWEGLHIYAKDPEGSRGFRHVACIPGRLRDDNCGGAAGMNKALLDEAYDMIRAHDGGSGVHVGQFGGG